MSDQQTLTATEGQNNNLVQAIGAGTFLLLALAIGGTIWVANSLSKNTKLKADIKL